ncbi:MAG: hypothetical protein JW885_02555 [Deltaproteobacteria bacterium]|nr:hypothetical protein [Candidatus Zymogenaceae bacterium]
MDFQDFDRIVNETVEAWKKEAEKGDGDWAQIFADQFVKDVFAAPVDCTCAWHKEITGDQPGKFVGIIITACDSLNVPVPVDATEEEVRRYTLQCLPNIQLEREAHDKIKIEVAGREKKRQDEFLLNTQNKNFKLYMRELTDLISRYSSPRPSGDALRDWKGAWENVDRFESCEKHLADARSYHVAICASRIVKGVADGDHVNLDEINNDPVFEKSWIDDLVVLYQSILHDTSASVEQAVAAIFSEIQYRVFKKEIERQKSRKEELGLH